MEATPMTNFDIDYTAPEKMEPFQDVIIVRNDAPPGSDPVVWPADGRPIKLVPGQVARMRRWQFMLGLKQRNAYEDPERMSKPVLKELSEEEGTLAYREAKHRQAQEDVNRLKQELKDRQDALAKAEKLVNQGKADIEAAVGSSEKPAEKPAEKPHDEAPKKGGKTSAI